MVILRLFKCTIHGIPSLHGALSVYSSFSSGLGSKFNCHVSDFVVEILNLGHRPTELPLYSC